MSRFHTYTRRKRHPGSQLKTLVEPGSAITNTNLCATVIDFLVNISTMKSVWQERRKLKNLSDDQLRDIGISWQAAELESKRSFSDIPEERKRSTMMRPSSKNERIF